MAKTTEHRRQGPSRRTLLKGAAAVAGVAAGTKALGGFPTVWAQDTKDITINHSGMSYSTIIQIAEQATVDLPFSVEMAVTDHAGMLNRLTTQSDSIDVADIELWMRVITVPRGIYQAVDPTKITHWDQTTSLYRDGTFDGKAVSRQGVSPHEVMYFADADATALADGTTDYATMTPACSTPTRSASSRSRSAARSTTGTSSSTTSSTAAPRAWTSRRS